MPAKDDGDAVTPMPADVEAEVVPLGPTATNDGVAPFAAGDDGGAKKGASWSDEGHLSTSSQKLAYKRVSSTVAGPFHPAASIAPTVQRELAAGHAEARGVGPPLSLA